MTERLHGYRDATAQASEVITSSWDATTGAIQRHVEALATGRESAKQALEGFTGDLLSAVGKEALAKGALYLLTGAVDTFVAPPLGLAELASGAGLVALGAALSAGGAGVSADASKGAAPPRRRRAREPGVERRVPRGGSTGSGGGVINVYMGSSTYLDGRNSSMPELADRFARHGLNVAASQLGTRLNSNLYNPPGG